MQKRSLSETIIRKLWIEQRFTAFAPEHHDCYIVEFPKSGITWLSTILANLSILRSEVDWIAGFSQAHAFIPDIHVTRKIHAGKLPGFPFRFIKSHSTFNARYPFVIYLVRNPVDVMLSYYAYLGGMRTLRNESFSAFIRDRKTGVAAWKGHINSWLDKPPSAQRLHLISYDSLLKEPVREFGRLSENFGWGFRDSDILKALKMSDFEAMKAGENRYRENNPRRLFQFVGSSKKPAASEEDREFILLETTEERRLLFCR